MNFRSPNLVRIFSSDEGILYHARRLNASTLLSVPRRVNKGSFGSFSVLVNVMNSSREVRETNVTKSPCLPPAWNSSMYNISPKRPPIDSLRRSGAGMELTWLGLRKIEMCCMSACRDSFVRSNGLTTERRDVAILLDEGGRACPISRSHRQA